MFLRVKADKISQLLDLVGELGLATVQVTHHPELVGLELDGFDLAVHRLDLLMRELQDLASSLRLVPVSSVFRRMERLCHDLAQQTGKPIELVLEGEEIEVDKVCRLPQFYEETSETIALTEQVIVVVKAGDRLLCLPVDDILGQQQVTMKSLPGQLKNIRAGAGCALLDSGEVAIALDCEQLNFYLIGEGHAQPTQRDI